MEQEKLEYQEENQWREIIEYPQSLLSEGGIKGWIKRRIYRILWWLIRPLYIAASEGNKAIDLQREQEKQDIAMLADDLAEQKEQADQSISMLADRLTGQKAQTEQNIAMLADRLTEQKVQTDQNVIKLTDRLAEQGMQTEQRLAILADGLTQQKVQTEQNITALIDRLAEQKAQTEQSIAILTDGLAQQKVQTEQNITALTDRLAEQKAEIEDGSKRSQQYEKEIHEKIGAVSRELMKVKWRQIDQIVADTESPEDELTCDICGASHKRKEYETRISACIFNGGKLIRYVCPECGVVFGPTKFSNLKKQEQDEDYIVHYFGFNEMDYTGKELKAFYLLNPNKDGFYLDYGCGRWSHTVEALREQGYQVFGYEPYAPDSENPYIITDPLVLQGMRFDGIFSNDLLEHLIDPVADMKFMKTLLKDPRAQISHSTTCYAYMYEFTRFHTHFFTGKSNEVLAEKSGFEILEYIDELHDETKDSDFICCVYGMKDAEVSYMDRMSVLGTGKREGRDFLLESGDLLYGPYLSSAKGFYQWHVVIEAQADLEYRVTLKSGEFVLKSGTLHPGENVIDYSLDEPTENVEVLIQNTTSDVVKVSCLALQ